MGRKPDYKLGAFQKLEEGHKGNVGAAWKNEDGTISIVLNPFVVLAFVDDLALTLFPTKEIDETPHANRV